MVSIDSLERFRKILFESDSPDFITLNDDTDLTLAQLADKFEKIYTVDTEAVIDSRRKVSFRSEWVRRLRSGKYKQGYNVLQSKEGCFCCLGVALEILGPALGYTCELDKGFYSYKSAGQTYGCVNMLPIDVWHLIFGDSAAASVCTRLMECNDRLKLSFNQIADEIETHVPDNLYIYSEELHEKVLSSNASAVVEQL